MRVLSVAAFGLSAGVVVVLVHELGLSHRTAAWSATVYVLVPTTSRYAQEARPYSLAMLLAVLCMWLLVRARNRTEAGRGDTHLWWCGHGIAAALLAIVQVTGLLILLAQAAVVLSAGARTRRRWTATVGAVALVTAPFIATVAAQRRAIAWLPAPEVDDLAALPRWFAGAPGVAAVLVTAALVAVARSLVGTSRTTPPGVSSEAIRLLLGWALLPAGALFAIGLVTPLYNPRYLLVSLPAYAIAAGCALAALPSRAAIAAGAAAVILAWPTHLAIRGPVGHGEDLRAAARRVSLLREPGDAIVFDPGDKRILGYAFPREFAGLTDPTLDRDPAVTGSLAGGWVDEAALPAALAGTRRVWVVTTPSSPTSDEVAAAAIRLVRGSGTLVGSWSFPPFEIALYERR